MADEAESYGTYQLRRVPSGDTDTDLEKFTDQSVHGYSFSADRPSLSARSEVIRKSLEVLGYDQGQSPAGLKSPASPYKKDLHSVFEMLHKTNLLQGPKEQENLVASLRRFQFDTDGTTQPSCQNAQQTLSKALCAELETQRTPDTREFMRRSSSCHSQIIITTEADEPWTILSFNDFASSVFGYPDHKFSSLGIIDLIKYDRRDWLTGMLAKESLSSLGATIPPSVPSRGFRRIQSTYEMFNLVDRDRKGPLTETSPLVMSSSRHSSARLWPIERHSTRPIPLRQPSDSDEIFVAKSNSRLTSASTTCLDTLGSSSPKRESTPKSAFESRSASESHNNFRLPKRQRVLLCGEVLPILKSSGKWSTASFWVKLKDNRLIWIIEEIQADVAYITVDSTGKITDQSSSIDDILSNRAYTPSACSTPSSAETKQDISAILPTLPRGTSGELDVESIGRNKYFAARQGDMDPVPCTLDVNTTSLGNSEATRIKVISLANIAGIMIVDPEDFCIKSYNRAFTSALFGVSELAGQPLTRLIPSFQELTRILKSTNEHSFTPGTIISEQAIRKAAALLLLAKGFEIDSFLRLPPVEAKHRDGSILKIDIQVRVVEESAQLPFVNDTTVSSESSLESSRQLKTFYALWISHSRRRHGFNDIMDTESQLSLFNQHLNINQPATANMPPNSPFRSDKKRGKFTVNEEISPLKKILGVDSTDKTTSASDSEAEPLPQNNIERLEAESQLLRSASLGKGQGHKRSSTTSTSDGSIKLKKDIHDFIVLENMGEGAYGQVKLAQYRSSAAKNKKVVLKYVIKKRILVDTWTRDRKWGTIPLEIHVLMYLRKHPHYAIVQMLDFFEDDVNYYIEMEPHGIPGMDLFDYIELKPSMDEVECKSLFFQIVAGMRHLHSLDIVHRDIKDENIILDELGRIKLIDFGSAAYCKHGPFDVFVGTIDYAAPEILSGKHYAGKPQDIWALGVLLYTMVYKENPFYNVDEIMEAEIRVPFKMSSSSIDLIRQMLDRNLDQRATIDQVAEHDWLSDASMVSSDVLSFVNRKA